MNLTKGKQMNEKEKQAFKKAGDKIADVLNKHYVEKIVPKHGDLLNMLTDEEEVEPYESTYDKQGKWKGSKYRVSFQDKEDK